jgi:hypothetical protein
LILYFIYSSLQNIFLFFMFKDMLVSYILIRIVIMASMSFTHTRILLLNTIMIRWVVIYTSHYLIRGLRFHEVSYLGLFPCRSFMLISLKISQSLWRQENIWIWLILSNGFLLMSLLDAALMSTLTILSLSIRYSFFF